MRHPAALPVPPHCGWSPTEPQCDTAGLSICGLVLRSAATQNIDMRTHDRIVIGHHLILHGYGHWSRTILAAAGLTKLAKISSLTWGPCTREERSINPRAKCCTHSGAMQRRCLIFLCCGSTTRIGKPPGN